MTQKLGPWLAPTLYPHPPQELENRQDSLGFAAIKLEKGYFLWPEPEVSLVARALIHDKKYLHKLCSSAY